MELTRSELAIVLLTLFTVGFLCGLFMEHYLGNAAEKCEEELNMTLTALNTFPTKIDYEELRGEKAYWKSQYFTLVVEQTDPKTKVELIE